MKELIIVIQIIVGIHLFIPFFLWLLAKGRRGEKLPAVRESKEWDYAIIVTAYQETAQIPQVVKSLLQMDYFNYLIYVVADNCDISDIHFEDERVILLKPELVLSSNIKSHFYAMQRFRRSHELITIIDSDNIVHPQYLHWMNVYFDRGFKAIQGVRQAKNLNTPFACLDEAGDIYYRFIDRKLLYDAGSSASLAGSGMAFTVELYKECLEKNPANGAGFDKILQYEILRKDYRIAFADEAVVLDEKTSKSDQLVKQRARWINTWFKFFLLGLILLGGSLRKMSCNKFLFSLMLLRPPLFLLVVFASASILYDLLFLRGMLCFWGGGIVTFIVVFWQSLEYFQADKRIYVALRSIPLFIFYQLRALLKAGKANQYSVATKHEETVDTADFEERFPKA